VPNKVCNGTFPSQLSPCPTIKKSASEPKGFVKKIPLVSEGYQKWGNFC